VEEVLRVALAELAAYREAAALFARVGESARKEVVGGMLLQNPWMARELPEGAARLSEARAALNRAAGVLRSLRQGPVRQPGDGALE